MLYHCTNTAARTADIRENDLSTFLIPGKLEAEPRAVLRPDLHPSSHVGAESRYSEQS